MAKNVVLVQKYMHINCFTCVTWCSIGLSENLAAGYLLQANMKSLPQPYLVVHQELGSFEVAWGDSHVVLLPWMVKLCQAPVNKPQLREQKQDVTIHCDGFVGFLLASNDFCSSSMSDYSGFSLARANRFCLIQQFNVTIVKQKHVKENAGVDHTLWSGILVFLSTFRCSWSIMTLCGFTSLCMIPILWQ